MCVCVHVTVKRKGCAVAVESSRWQYEAERQPIWGLVGVAMEPWKRIGVRSEWVVEDACTYGGVGLGGGGDLFVLVHPRRGMHRHTPVAPRADLCVLGRHLDDVFLPHVRVRDGVGGAVRQLYLTANHRERERERESGTPQGKAQISQ